MASKNCEIFHFLEQKHLFNYSNNFWNETIELYSCLYFPISYVVGLMEDVCIVRFYVLIFGTFLPLYRPAT